MNTHNAQSKEAGTDNKGAQERQSNGGEDSVSTRTQEVTVGEEAVTAGMTSSDQTARDEGHGQGGIIAQRCGEGTSRQREESRDGVGMQVEESVRIQQGTGEQSTGESGNAEGTEQIDTGREERSGVRMAQAEGEQRAQEQQGIMTREEMEEAERVRLEREEVVSGEQWAEEAAREMEHEVGGEGDTEYTAQAVAGPSENTHASETTESQVSEEGSIRSDQHGTTQHTDTTHVEDTVAGGGALQQAEQREEDGEHGVHTPQPVNTPTIVSDAAAQHLETFLGSAEAVNSGHEQRARRGVSKPPGAYVL